MDGVTLMVTLSDQCIDRWIEGDKDRKKETDLDT